MYVMSLHSPTQNQNSSGLNSRTSCHSRMLVAGIQEEFGLDPRLKHSGLTIVGGRISSPQPQFSKERTKDKEMKLASLFHLPWSVRRRSEQLPQRPAPSV